MNTTTTNTAADPHALRAEVTAQADAIADMLGITPQAALREVYGGPPCARVYCGPPDECPESALEGVLFTGFYTHCRADIWRVVDSRKTDAGRRQEAPPLSPRCSSASRAEPRPAGRTAQKTMQ